MEEIKVSEFKLAKVKANDEKAKELGIETPAQVAEREEQNAMAKTLEADARIVAKEEAKEARSKPSASFIPPELQGLPGVKPQAAV